MQQLEQPETLVVVGDASLAARAAELVPAFRVLGAGDDAELGDPATSLAPIGALLDRGHPPAAVLCTGGPGFTVLAQLRRFPLNRCYVLPTDSPWPLPTLQCLVDAAGMTLLQGLENLPAALSGRSSEGVRRPGYEEIPTGPRPDPEGAVERLRAAKAPSAPAPPAQEREPEPEDFGWAEAPKVQVPPAPMTMAGGGESGAPLVLDASEGPARAPSSAYLPADLLRPLRPRQGQQ